MLFTTPAYLFFFFPPVWLGARLLRQRGQKLWLCASLLLFYAFASLSALPLLLGFALFHYGMGRWLQGRKTLLITGVAVDIALLIACKAIVPAPPGVSFFTFQGIAYLVEIYRHREKASRDFTEVLLYLCFFPRLLCGPLMGWDEHHTQYESLTITSQTTATGLRRFVRGMGKKLLLSDMLAITVNEIYATNPAALGSLSAWIGAVAYCLQLYFDFSSYSDMAIGMGQCFGFTFPENFDRPFVSGSIGGFWRRWHISLGNWFKDYVYIPLGGNRHGRVRTAVNKFIVFLLTGLWHGIGWPFLLWGAWHGLFSALESLVKVKKPISRLYTPLVVLLGFVMFRAESAMQGFALIGKLFSFSTGPLPALSGVEMAALALALPLSLVKATDSKLPPAVSNVLTLLLYLLCLCVMAGNDFAPFIYAQF